MPLVVLAFGGYVKGSRYLSWAPIDITLLAAAVVTVQVIRTQLRGGRRMPRRGLLLLWAASLLGGFIATRNPDNTYAAAKQLHVLVLAPLCVLGGIYLLGGNTRRRAWVAGIALIGFLTLGIAYADPGSQSAGLDPNARLVADGGSTIGLGRAAGAALVVVLVLALFQRSGRVAHLGLAAIAAVAMFGAASRGPVIGAGIATIATVLLAKRRGRWFRGLVVLAASAAVFQWAKNGGVNSRLFLVGDTSSEMRSYLWARAWESVPGHPYGIGWGGLYDYLGVAVLDSGYTQYPHNVLLEVVSEGGWAAGAVLCLVLALAFSTQKQAMKNPTEAALLAVFIFMFINAMVSGDVNGNRGLWVAIGAAFAAPHADSLRQVSTPHVNRRLQR